MAAPLASSSVSSSEVDDLVVNDANLLTQSGTIQSGENLTRGAVLGQIAIGGDWILSLAAAIDGSEVPAGILVEDTDASGGDEPANIYWRGDFNRDSAMLTVGAGHTADGIAQGLADKGIWLIPSTQIG